jgi:hypothetical protein
LAARTSPTRSGSTPSSGRSSSAQRCPAFAAAAGEARRRVAVVAGVLGPIYFVTSGMTVDIPALRWSDAADLVLIVAAACAAKFAGAVAPDRPVHSLGGPKKVARGVEEPVVRIHRG